MLFLHFGLTHQALCAASDIGILLHSAIPLLQSQVVKEKNDRVLCGGSVESERVAFCVGVVVNGFNVKGKKPLATNSYVKNR